MFRNAYFIDNDMIMMDKALCVEEGLFATMGMQNYTQR